MWLGSVGRRSEQEREGAVELFWQSLAEVLLKRLERRRSAWKNSSVGCVEERETGRGGERQGNLDEAEKGGGGGEEGGRKSG